MGFFAKIRDGLKKTRESISSRVHTMLHSYSKIDDELYEQLEEVLIMGDVGVNTAEEICDNLRVRVKEEGIKDPAEVENVLEAVVEDTITGDQEMHLDTKPSVIIVIGVNGVGKTTSIGKMAAYYKNQGKKVIIGAADTFRAAAIEQLGEWAKRADVQMIQHGEGTDPAAVVYDTLSAAQSQNADIAICDTAGRLHNQKNLMNELGKIVRTVDKVLPDASREILLVVDATTGQNAINQARAFKEAAGITGIVLTKLDGSSKGGVVLSVKGELGIPVKFIGVGEHIDDLQPFNAHEFAAALFDRDDLVVEDENIDSNTQ
jgi:fused signal recognition particle receptor